MTRLLLAVSAVALLGVAACSDATDDVVQAPAAGMAPGAVTEARADTAATTAALALGMTRDQLEDADLLSSANTDLGDVETLVLDASGQVASLVVELEGVGDRKVVVPISGVSSIKQGDDVDLTTKMSVAELTALPIWDPAAPR